MADSKDDSTEDVEKSDREMAVLADETLRNVVGKEGNKVYDVIAFAKYILFYSSCFVSDNSLRKGVKASPKEVIDDISSFAKENVEVLTTMIAKANAEKAAQAELKPVNSTPKDAPIAIVKDATPKATAKAKKGKSGNGGQ